MKAKEITPVNDKMNTAGISSAFVVLFKIQKSQNDHYTIQKRMIL